MKAKKLLSLVTVVTMLAGSYAFPNPVGAEEAVANASTEAEETVSAAEVETETEAEETIPAPEEETKAEAKRTIMLYLCASNLEENGGMATFNLKQALGANFSKDENVNLIVYSGGAHEWDPEIEKYLEGAKEISTEHNQIWQLYGADAPEHASKMVLLETSEKQSKYELMTDPSVLTGFIDYCALNYPAEKYDLIFWDHGGGPVGGYGADMHIKDLTKEEQKTAIDKMTIPLIVQGLQESAVSKFDIVDFDCCLMGNLEIAVSLSDLSDYLIISPELEPGYGQEYSCWLNLLGEDSSVSSYTLGTTLLDGFKAFYESGEGGGEMATLTLVDTEKLLASDLLPACSNIADEMIKEGKEAAFYDEIRSARDSVKYNNLGLYDLGNFTEQLGIKVAEITEEDLVTNHDLTNEYTKDAMTVSEVLRDPAVIYAVYTDNMGKPVEASYIRNKNGKLDILVDENYMPTGLSIYFEANKEFDYTDTGDYIRDMKAAAGMLPDTNVKGKAFLEKEMEAARDYDLIQRTGSAVSSLIQWGFTPAEIDYSAVKKVWQGYTFEDGAWIAPEEDMGSIWEDWIAALMEGEEATIKVWLENVISVQEVDAVKSDAVSAVKLTGEEGQESYRIVLEDTNRLIVGGVGVEVYAELPQLKEYLATKATPEEKELAERAGITDSMKIGSMMGEENLDAVQEIAHTKEYIAWYHGSVSSWDLDEYDDTWYAVKDAGGQLYGVSNLVQSDDGRSYVRAFYEEDGNRYPVLVGFMKREDGEFEAPDVLYYGTDGSGRKVNLADLTEALTLTACRTISKPDETFIFPISASSFVLSKETAPTLSLGKYPIDQIPEIGDVDGDGIAATHSYAVEDLYHSSYDIDQAIHEAPSKQKNDFKVTPDFKVFEEKKLKKKKKTVKLEITGLSKSAPQPETKILSVGNGQEKKVKINKKGAIVIKKGIKPCMIIVNVSAPETDLFMSHTEQVMFLIMPDA